MKDKILNGCISKDGKEIDGLEFSITSLSELIGLLKEHKEVHLNYFDDEDDLNLWLEVKE